MSRPTAADRRYWRKISLLGCIACRQDGFDTPAEIHHIKDYGNHNHRNVIPLCPCHHRSTAGVKGVPSIHGQPKEFAQKYGTTDELLAECKKMIGEVI